MSFGILDGLHVNVTIHRPFWTIKYQTTGRFLFPIMRMARRRSPWASSSPSYGTTTYESGPLGMGMELELELEMKIGMDFLSTDSTLDSTLEFRSSSEKTPSWLSDKKWVLAAVLLCGTSFLWSQSTPPTTLPDPIWNWDYYHYTPKGVIHNDTLLIVQWASTTDEIALTSRPNRAYAKQWEADYVQIVGPILQMMSPAHIILRTIQDRRQQNNSTTSRNYQSSTTIIGTTYAFLLLLPADAVLTNLDMDIRTWITNHPNVLVAMTTTNNVMMWNLNHDQCSPTIQRWGQWQHLNVAEDLVHPLPVSDTGFIEPKLMKLQQVTNQPQDVIHIRLQTTADAVCYRYYPKCEVW